MAMFIRAKRVTAPLGERVRAQLHGGGNPDLMTTSQPVYFSSGSEHDAGDPSYFSGLVRNFLDGINSAGRPSVALADEKNRNSDDEEDEEEGENSFPSPAGIVREIIKSFPQNDDFRDKLILDVNDAAKAASEQRLERSAYHRSVMARLRDAGYDAGLCKSKWSNGPNLASVDYVYIDVVADRNNKRYIIDLAFAGEFEVARATAEYGRAVAALPNVMVETAEEVRRLVSTMAHAGRRSLRRTGMHVPPWRKARYMLAKWLGPYRRTTNPIPSSSAAEIKRSAVGFCSSRGFILPATATIL